MSSTLSPVAPPDTRPKPPGPPGAGRSSLSWKSFWSGTATVSVSAGRLLAGIIVARALGPDGMGRVVFLLWIADIAGKFTNFGLGATLTRFYADLQGQGKREQADYLGHWIFTRYSVIVFIGSAVLLAVPSLSSGLKIYASIWPIVTIYFALQASNSLYQAYLAGRQQFDRLARLNTASSLILVAAVGFGALRFGVPGAIGGYLAGAALPAAFCLTLFRTKSPVATLDPALRHRLWQFAFYTWLAVLVSAFVWSRAEIFFLNRYCGPRQVALFGVGIAFATLAQRSLIFFSGFLMPHFSGLQGKNDLASLRKDFARVTRLMAFVLLPVCFLLAAVIPTVLPLIYGHSFSGAIPVAMVTVCFAAIGFGDAASSVIYALEKSWFIAMGGVSGALLSLAGCLVIIPSAGAIGAAWSRGIVQSLMMALWAWYVVVRLGMPYPLKAIVRMAGCAAAPAAGIYFLVIRYPNLGFVLLFLPAGAIAYLALCRLSRALPDDDVLTLVRGVKRFSPGSASALLSLFALSKQNA